MDPVIYDLIDYYFPGSTKNYNNQYYGIIDDGECLSFYIQDKSMYLSGLNKCKYSGTENLEKLEIFARAIKIEKISLVDESTISWKDIEIDLATIKILSNGQSWYNSLGYYSENHREESRKWNCIRNLTFLDVKDSLLLLTYSEYDSKSNYSISEDGFSLFCNYYEFDDIDNFQRLIKKCIDFMYENISEFDLDNTFIKVVSGYIYLQIKNNVEFDYPKQIAYYSYLTFIFLLKDINYTRDPLIKILN